MILCQQTYTDTCWDIAAELSSNRAHLVVFVSRLSVWCRVQWTWIPDYCKALWSVSMSCTSRGRHSSVSRQLKVVITSPSVFSLYCILLSHMQIFFIIWTWNLTRCKSLLHAHFLQMSQLSCNWVADSKYILCCRKWTSC